MAFGVKIKSVKTKEKYTIESLYEAIKDKEFTAGAPSLTKHGIAMIITFPALDRNNQVWVMASGFGSKDGTNKFSIQKQEEAGVDNAVKNAIIGGLTDGWGNIGANFGANAKKCEQLVEATAKELDALGL